MDFWFGVAGGVMHGWGFWLVYGIYFFVMLAVQDAREFLMDKISVFFGDDSVRGVLGMALIFFLVSAFCVGVFFFLKNYEDDVMSAARSGGVFNGIVFFLFMIISFIASLGAFLGGGAIYIASFVVTPILFCLLLLFLPGLCAMAAILIQKYTDEDGVSVRGQVPYNARDAEKIVESKKQELKLMETFMEYLRVKHEYYQRKRKGRWR